MSLEIIKVSTKKTGVLYKILENNHNITIKLTNIKALFAPDKYYNNFYIKWHVNIEHIYKIIKIENILIRHFEKKLKSNIIKKDNYPLMLNTKFVYNKSNPMIIEKRLMNVPEFIENNLGNSYNIVIEIGKIFIDNDDIKYPLIIKAITVC